MAYRSIDKCKHIFTARKRSVCLSKGGGCLVPGVCLVETPPATATAASGAHPTGMHSCYVEFSNACPSFQILSGLNCIVDVTGMNLLVLIFYI